MEKWKANIMENKKLAPDDVHIQQWYTMTHVCQHFVSGYSPAFTCAWATLYKSVFWGDFFWTWLDGANWNWVPMWCERKTAALVCQQSLPEIHCAHTWSSNYFYTVQFLPCPRVFKSYPTLNIGFISFFKLVWLQPVPLIVSSTSLPLSRSLILCIFPIPSLSPIFPVTLTGINISMSLVDLETLVNTGVDWTLLGGEKRVCFVYQGVLKECFLINTLH